MMRVGSWRDDDVPGRVAAELGLSVARERLRTTPTGGESPLRTLDAVATRIAAGESWSHPDRGCRSERPGHRGQTGTTPMGDADAASARRAQTAGRVQRDAARVRRWASCARPRLLPALRERAARRVRARRSRRVRRSRRACGPSCRASRSTTRSRGRGSSSARTHCSTSGRRTEWSCSRIRSC